MNKVLLVGNLTRDPEKRSTGQGTSVTSFTIAVSRRFKNADGGYDADFINCVAWRSTADFVAQYFQKGSRIGVVGSLQSRSYDDKNGNRRYVTEVNVEEVEFAGPRQSADAAPRAEQPAAAEPVSQPSADDIFGDELAEFQPLEDSELPF
ncbi:MAG: single-stranded DNA-binding protein [Christensenellaceae bacterium]|nr:single-stranded DNA-binding protein [Christensenellaceae bacterium]